MDTELKKVCEEFISTAVDAFVSPLTSFLDKIDTLEKLADEEGKEKRHLINQQPFAKPGEQLEGLLSFFLRRIRESYAYYKHSYSHALGKKTLTIWNYFLKYVKFWCLLIKFHSCLFVLSWLISCCVLCHVFISYFLFLCRSQEIMVLNIDSTLFEACLKNAQSTERLSD